MAVHRKFTLLLSVMLLPLITADEALSVSVTAIADTSSTYPKVLVSWLTTLTFASVSVTWHQCTYTDQVTCRELGRQAVPDVKTTSFQLTDAVKFDSQFLLTVRGADACGHVTSSSAYVTVSKPSKDHPRPHEPLYLVLGPVTTSNVTVEWGWVLGNRQQLEVANPPSFMISWRRVDGTLGHPGHYTTLVTTRHLIQGLLPAVRYEVCVRGMLQKISTSICAKVYTLEAAPGPPSPNDAWCGTEARGTHWRCDVTWEPPVRTNGKIVSYTVQWRDSQGYTLDTIHPRSSLCFPECQSTAVLSFHPHEACITAATSAGGGWEACVLVHDTQSRLMAAFDRKILYAIAGTLMLYIFGPRLLVAFFKCCARGLAPQAGEDKHHQV